MKNGVIEKIAITVGIIFVIAIGVFIFVLKKENDINKIVNVEKKVKEVKKEEIVKKDDKVDVAIDDEFSDWKTYEDEEYGFEFKYPSDFSIKKEKFMSGDFVAIEKISDNGKISFHVDVNTDGFGPIFYDKTFILENKSGNLVVKSEKIIDKDEWSDDGRFIAGTPEKINFKEDMYNFGYSYSEKDDLDILLKKILSTFKFSE